MTENPCEVEDCEQEYLVELVLYLDGSGEITEDKQMCLDHAIEYLFKKKIEQTNKAIVHLEKMNNQIGKIKKDMSSLNKIASKIGVVSCDGIR